MFDDDRPIGVETVVTHVSSVCQWYSGPMHLMPQDLKGSESSVFLHVLYKGTLS